MPASHHGRTPGAHRNNTVRPHGDPRSDEWPVIFGESDRDDAPSTRPVTSVFNRAAPSGTPRTGRYGSWAPHTTSTGRSSEPNRDWRCTKDRARPSVARYRRSTARAIAGFLESRYNGRAGGAELHDELRSSRLKPVGGAAVGADRGDRFGGRERVGDDRVAQAAGEGGEAVLVGRWVLTGGTISATIHWPSSMGMRYPVRGIDGAWRARPGRVSSEVTSWRSRIVRPGSSRSRRRSVPSNRGRLADTNGQPVARGLERLPTIVTSL